MSVVTDVVLLFGLRYDEEAVVMPRINEFFGPDRRGLVLLNESDQYGGNKALQGNVAVGAFNYLDLRAFIAHLRALPWAEWDIDYVQLVLQEEEDWGFGMLNIIAPEAPFDPARYLTRTPEASE